MPEGDTVWRTAHRLDQALGRQPIQSAEIRWGQVATPNLIGRTTLEVVSRGKHILHRIEGGVTVHTHLRMEGQWRIVATPEVSAGLLARRDLRILVSAPEWTGLGLRLGMLDVVETRQEATLVGHLGPDVLGPDWDLAAALARLRREPGRPLVDCLLDQRNLAGIGTMYAAETLFLERLWPWTPVGELTEARLSAVVERAHRLLDHNKAHAVQSTTGRRGRGETAYVHGRSGLPCRRCGHVIRVANSEIAPQQRVVFSCPDCQGGLGPGDDGAAQSPLGTGTRVRSGYRRR
ncbi:MAG TPA: DNA-formamidopyrimidine glycosylase family protein [Dermatophilaceae bacterium]|nr:DNA-formamidopyrimidine glycosylase family protein [Dermatophilaceae bacterium]